MAATKLKEKAAEVADPGFDRVVMERFASFERNGRLAHAYLFAGPKGIGKFSTGIAAAKWINCEEREGSGASSPCGSCPSCRKIEGGNHPDVRVVDAGAGNSVKISDVRDIINRIQLKPYEARKKVYILKDAENLTIEAGNALLKTLEEPAKDSLLILTTSSSDKVLGTIRSRCHRMTFFPLSLQKLAGELRDDYSMNDEEAAFFAGYSQGCRGRALELHRGDFFDEKNEMIDRLVLQEDHEAYLKGLLSDKQAIRDLLEVLLSWFRDVLLLKNGAGRKQIVHADRYGDLTQQAPQYSQRQVCDIIGQVINAIKMLNENLNIKVPLTLIREKIWVKA